MHDILFHIIIYIVHLKLNFSLEIIFALLVNYMQIISIIKLIILRYYYFCV
jgi:hypothetical protein